MAGESSKMGNDLERILKRFEPAENLFANPNAKHTNWTPRSKRKFEARKTWNKIEKNVPVHDSVLVTCPDFDFARFSFFSRFANLTDSIAAFAPACSQACCIWVRCRSAAFFIASSSFL